MRPLALAFLLVSLACVGDAQSPETTASVEAASPAEAEPPSPPPTAPELQTAWMVILSGATDEAAGQADLEEVRAKGIARQEGGHPRLVHSDTVEGLKPGFWISVAATVDDQATATAISEAVRPRYDGAYVREVRVSEPESVRCPGDLRCKPMRDPAWRAVVVFDVIGGDKGEDWGWFTDRVVKKSNAYGVPAYWAEGTEVRIKTGEESTEVLDLSPFMGELFGYVFVEEGKAPEYCAHLPSDLVLSAASDYFTFDLLND